MNKTEKQKQLINVNEVVKMILADFVGRDVRDPLLLAEAEGRIRERITHLINKGDYVMADGLEFDRVELSPNMQIQIFFRRVETKKDLDVMA
jgi:hypothetical protein